MLAGEFEREFKLQFMAVTVAADRADPSAVGTVLLLRRNAEDEGPDIVKCGRVGLVESGARMLLPSRNSADLGRFELELP